MNFQHLRYFLAVARSGRFTTAARQQHVTQPTVSSAIAELEQELGVRLFHRGRQVELTLQGRTLVDYAVQIEDLLDEALERVTGGLPQPGDSFRFGAIDAAVIYLLPEVLRDFVAHHPDVELAIEVGPTSRDLVEHVLANRAEFAVISLPYEHPRLRTLAVMRDEMPLVVGPSHPLAGRRRVRTPDIAAEPFILFQPDSVSRRIVDEHFTEVGITPRVVMEMRSPEAMRKLVEAGVGVSFLPRIAVAESLTAGTLKEVRVTGLSLHRQIGLAWRQGRYFGPAVRALVEALLSQYGLVEDWRREISS
ncbi:MAG: LysR family transcriptional regulator [Candidatus Latescibacterota bacterium]|nr:LysR family transcriptional regulator [Candidatus Latescibacterota bacterium]